LGKEVFGVTNPLLVTSSGQKMGKTANGAVWLSRDMLSPYDFWQYWRNVDDADVIKLLYLFTDIDVEQIKKMESVKGQELNEIKKILADEVTTIAHGKDSLEEIHRTAAGIFGDSKDDLASLTSIPKYCLTTNDLKSTSIVDIMVNGGMCASRGDAKRLLRSNGVYLNGQPIAEDYKIPHDLSAGDKLKLSCGKKKHLLIWLTCDPN
jgi:tyrosyl-tRNA synthetase